MAVGIRTLIPQPQILQKYKNMQEVVKKMMVACSNSSGERTFFLCILKGTEEEYENGDFYDAAVEKAKENGYEGPFCALDELDEGGARIHHCFSWYGQMSYESKNGDWVLWSQPSRIFKIPS